MAEPCRVVELMDMPYQLENNALWCVSNSKAGKVRAQRMSFQVLDSINNLGFGENPFRFINCSQNVVHVNTDKHLRNNVGWR